MHNNVSLALFDIYQYIYNNYYTLYKDNAGEITCTSLEWRKNVYNQILYKDKLYYIPVNIINSGHNIIIYYAIKL